MGFLLIVLVPLQGALPSWPVSSHFLTPSPLGVRIQCMNLGETQIFKPQQCASFLCSPFTHWYSQSSCLGSSLFMIHKFPSPKPDFHHLLLTLKNRSSAQILSWDPDSNIQQSTGYFHLSKPLVPQNCQVPRWTNYLYSQTLFCNSHLREWYHWTAKNGAYILSLLPPTYHITTIYNFPLLNISDFSSVFPDHLHYSRPINEFIYFFVEQGR